jgi:hypothetical protein
MIQTTPNKHPDGKRRPYSLIRRLAPAACLIVCRSCEAIALPRLRRRRHWLAFRHGAFLPGVSPSFTANFVLARARRHLTRPQWLFCHVNSPRSLVLKLHHVPAILRNSRYGAPRPLSRADGNFFARTTAVGLVSAEVRPELNCGGSARAHDFETNDQEFAFWQNEIPPKNRGESRPHRGARIRSQFGDVGPRCPHHPAPINRTASSRSNR